MKRKEKEKEKQNKHYSLERIKKENAQYNIIYGERSNGKTFAVEEEGIKNYLSNERQMAIVRRYDLDLTGARAQAVFEHFVHNPEKGNLIEQWSNGKWCDVYYYSKRWFLCTYDEKGNRLKDTRPFCYGFSLAGQEHDKSTSYPDIEIVLFDEFLTRDLYLTDEFILFTNVLSTIIRNRDDVKIYMCGNTVNKYNPYFKEMGLDNVLKMRQGEIQVYEFALYNNKVLKIAVEYADSPSKDGKPSDVYFAFKNPKLKMITSGVWELAIYPHLPIKYKREQIVGEYYILWESEILHCEIIQSDTNYFTYIHSKTTPIKNEDESLIFTQEFDMRPNVRRKITDPFDDIGRKIYWFFRNDKVFYQDNEVGEVVRNYIQWCKSDKGFV